MGEHLDEVIAGLLQAIYKRTLKITSYHLRCWLEQECCVTAVTTQDYGV